MIRHFVRPSIKVIVSPARTRELFLTKLASLKYDRYLAMPRRFCPDWSAECAAAVRWWVWVVCIGKHHSCPWGPGTLRTSLQATAYATTPSRLFAEKRAQAFSTRSDQETTTKSQCPSFVNSRDLLCMSPARWRGTHANVYKVWQMVPQALHHT